MFFAASYYYWLPILLQALCVWHCVKRHRPNNWIWIIVFLPVVGSLVYIFSEVFSGRDIEKVQTGMGNIFNPGSSVRRLEENLRFSDTFANRIALADAYLATGNTDQAIELYESSLNGNFSENEHVQCQLMIAYYQQKRYEEVISIGKKVYKRPQFARSKQHILYAASLGNIGLMEEAENEFRTMKARYANYEARYYYAVLLLNTGRTDSGRQLLTEMLSEVSHLSPPERRLNRTWFRLCKEELGKVKQNHPA